MTPFQAMTAREGWRDLRRRLPSLERAYKQQRAIRWGMLTLLGAGTVAGAALWVGRSSVGSKRSQNPEAASGFAAKASGAHPGLENLPDADTRVESQ